MATLAGATPIRASGMIPELERSIRQVVSWIENHDYRAYDPGDGDLSFLRHATLGIPFFRRLLTASVLRMPFHIRPLIGIRPHTSTKGMGYIAWGYTKMYALTGHDSYRQRAEYCLDWLIKNRSPGEEHYCWGNHFAFVTRGGVCEALTPTIVWSSLIGLAFLEAYHTFGSARYLDVAESVTKWIKALPRHETSSGLCLSYVAYQKSSIHNSNMLGASLLAKVAELRTDREGMSLAREAMKYSCTRQNADGSWYYGEEEKYHWIDNFHTGYNLDSLKRYCEASGSTEFAGHLRRGLTYFLDHFFEADGRPRYYTQRRYPIDIQCAAQAIDTLVFLSDISEHSVGLAGTVAGWTIRNMQAPDGHFYYRDLGWKKVKTPMLHWGQGTMFKALAGLLTALNESGAA